VTGLVGRDAELATLRGLFEPTGPGRATLVAAAGMGKTALVEALLLLADPRDVTVLHARPLETERQLGFSGLLDLFQDLPPDTWDPLPAPQRTALRAALLLDQHHGGVDPRAVAAGVRGVLQGLAAQRRVVLVVDDAQWLDAGSAAALGQAMARIPDGVGLLTASRPSGRSTTEWLDRVDVQCVLQPMTEGELFEVVRRHLGRAPDAGELRSLAVASAGNPLHALELARHRAGGPAGFDHLLGGRVENLDRSTRLALLAAALASAPSVDLVASARGLDAVATVEVLEEAIQAGLVTVETKVRFRHPLYAQAVIDGAAQADVTQTHRTLALLEPLLESRAWHQGVAHPLPEAGLARELEAAARSTRERGAWDASVDLLELAVTRSPEQDPARLVRALELAGWLHLSGRPAEAERWYRRVWEEGTGALRWEAGIGLAEALLYLGREAECLELEQELAHQDLPDRLSVLLAVRVQATANSGRYDVTALLSRAQAMLSELPPTPDVSALLSTVLVAEADRRRNLAQPFEPLLRQAELLETDLSGVRVLGSAALAWAHTLSLGDRHDEARSRFAALRTRCEEGGDDFSVPLVLAQAAYLERRAGSWDRALELMREGERSAAGQGQVYLWLLEASRAGLDGLRGDHDGSVAALERLRPLLRSAGEPAFDAIVLQRLGQVHLAHREDELAWVTLAESREITERHGLLDPADMGGALNLAEAGLLTGRLAEVEAQLLVERERAEAMGCRENVLIGCGHLEVGLRAGRGDLEGAVEGIEAMLEAHDHGPVEAVVRARAHLTAGRVYRRALRKRLAHQSLTRAVELFEQIGSPPYAAQARAELGRVGLRPRGGQELTPTERQVCELASEGLRNRDIAERSFLSVKTVEAVLGRAYRKLEIRTRSELARALDRGVPQE
jgi:DNA-binding CsgD family transcriptional regulator